MKRFFRYYQQTALSHLSLEGSHSRRRNASNLSEDMNLEIPVTWISKRCVLIDCCQRSRLQRPIRRITCSLEANGVTHLLSEVVGMRDQTTISSNTQNGNGRAAELGAWYQAGNLTNALQSYEHCQCLLRSYICGNANGNNTCYNLRVARISCVFMIGFPRISQLYFCGCGTYERWSVRNARMKAIERILLPIPVV